MQIYKINQLGALIQSVSDFNFVVVFLMLIFKLCF